MSVRMAWGWCAAGLGALLGVAGLSAGCADALRLEPAGAGGSATGPTTSVGGGGGGVPVPCESSLDCPPGQGVCDLAAGECRECLDGGDCGHKPGTACAGGICQCPTAGETWCGQFECADTATSPDHCGSCDHACFGSCVDSACSDPWEPLPAEDAPAARGRHVAVMADTKMLVWGGLGSGSVCRFDGGIYDTTTFKWTAMSPVGAPAGREYAQAVWTGSKMLVWGGHCGGVYYNDGGVYDPATNTWAPMSMTNAPSARIQHVTVWTGTEMIVWGGIDDTNELTTGGKYDPATDIWTAVMSQTVSRRLLSAVWSESTSRMFIYGGRGDTLNVNNIYFPGDNEAGGRTFDPVGNAWQDLSKVGEPSARALHTAVWDGPRMLVFGGHNGTNYLGNGFKLEGNTWNQFVGAGPSARGDHTAVWVETAQRMVVFGGRNATSPALADGGVFNSSTNEWDRLLPTAIEARFMHTAVATDTTMLVFGGFNGAGTPLASGGVYRP